MSKVIKSTTYDKLYHVSFTRVPEFYPRVPNERAQGEDSTIARVCFSDSIENCIAAMPGGVSGLSCLKRLGINPVIYVYEALVPENAPYLMYPDKVVEYVPDALFTNEHWLLEIPKDLTIAERAFYVDDFTEETQEDLYGNKLYYPYDFVLGKELLATDYDNVGQLLTLVEKEEDKEKVLSIIERNGMTNVLRNLYEAINMLKAYGI